MSDTLRTVRLEKVKEAANTFRFQEINEPYALWSGTLYLSKKLFNGVVPQEIEVQVKVIR